MNAYLTLIKIDIRLAFRQRIVLFFSYLMPFAFFLIFAALIWNLRRSTSGLALRAVRDSTAASRTIGLSVVQVKVLVGSLGAFVAAVGGGFYAMDQSVANPQVFATFLGLVDSRYAASCAASTCRRCSRTRAMPRPRRR